MVRLNSATLLLSQVKDTIRTDDKKKSSHDKSHKLFKCFIQDNGYLKVELHPSVKNYSYVSEKINVNSRLN